MPNEPYAELAELAGSFIHEIKNHLSTLGLNLQLLAEDFHEPESRRERRALERIKRLQHECQRLVEVSNDFLRFARGKDLNLEPAKLVEVVQEVVDFFAPSARQNNIDIALIKNTRISEGKNIEFRAEALNAANHPYFPNPSLSVTTAQTAKDTGFGQISASTQSNYARRLQMSLRLVF